MLLICTCSMLMIIYMANLYRSILYVRCGTCTCAIILLDVLNPNMKYAILKWNSSKSTNLLDESSCKY